MIFNIKKLLIIFTLFPFILNINEPATHFLEIQNKEIISNKAINSENKINSFLSFANSECKLRFKEMVIKYVFREDGDEINIQVKYVNRGNLNICTIIKNFSAPFQIINATLEGGENLNYKSESNGIEINFNLESDKDAILKYKLFLEYSPSKFYRQVSFDIYNGIKYIFRARQPIEIVGSEYGKLKEGKQKNGALYYYFDGDEITDNFNEIIYLSAHEIRFKSEFNIELDWLFWRQLYYVKIPNMHVFGNNKITSYIVFSNLEPNEYTVKTDKKYIIIKSDKWKRSFSFTITKEFRSNINNEWVIDGDIENTCTTKTKNKVQEILSNSNSKEKNYVILGRWVYENIKYNLDYVGMKWTVDEILEYGTGVCSHKARLFNAFLNCIDIDAVYATGYAHTSNDKNIDSHTLHAWTVAKIEGKWVPMDATWNIFNGKLPLGFIFRYYHDDNRGYDADWHIFKDLLNDKSPKRKLGSNPQVSLNIKAISFISRELDDDDEGDFKVIFDNNIDNTNNNLIIIVYFVILIVLIIIAEIYKRNKKGKRPNEDEEGISLTIIE